MFEERRLHPKAKLLAAGFLAAALILVLLQSLAVFGLGGLLGIGKSSVCSTGHSVSQRHYERALFDGWEELELGTCSGPQFAKLEKVLVGGDGNIVGEGDSDTGGGDVGERVAGYMLSMNCTSFGNGVEDGEQTVAKGDFSFSFEDSSRLRYAYEGPTLLLAGGHAPEVADEVAGGVYLQRWAEREYVVGRCSIPGLFAEQQMYTNVLVKEPNPLIRDRALRRRLQLDLEREAAAAGPAGLPAQVAVPEPTVPMNVIVLLVGALSEPHLRRTMPLTLGVLDKLAGKHRRETNVFHFRRYNAVAEEPLANHVPLYSGRAQATAEDDGSQVVRAEEAKAWLWDWYQAHGYVTMFSEEHCILGDSVRKYFRGQAPFDHRFTDLYCQIASDPYYGSTRARLKGLPFDDDEDDEKGGVGVSSIGQEQGREERGWRRGRSCAGNKYLHTLALEYLAQLLDNYANSPGLRGEVAPVFATLLLMEAHEPSMLRVRTLDRSLAHFLKLLHSAGHLENTAVVLASDVGQFKNSFARTPLGKREQREPFLYLLMPEMVLMAYPEVRAMLHGNSAHLCTPYDLYATLRRLPLLSVRKSEDGKPTGVTSVSYKYRERDPAIPRHSYSLLDEYLPAERSCKAAQVPSGMCRCVGTAGAPFDLLLLYGASLLLACVLMGWWGCVWVRRRM